MNIGKKVNNNIKETKGLIEKDEIELTDIISSLNRNKILTFLIVGTSFVLSSVYAYTKKPTWEGQFKIVIAKGNSNNSSVANNLLQNLPKFNSINISPFKKTATEIEILKSPSVLMPIFTKIKNIKKEKGDNIDNKRFSNWLNDSVLIKLSRGTSVLNISYQDTDKDLILPILNDISYTYQNYSLSDKKESLKSALNFSNKKIEELKKKNLQYLRKSEEYAILHNLNPYNVERRNFKVSDISNFAFGSLSTEVIRKDANRIINDSKITLKQLNNLDPSERSFLYISKFVPELSTSKIFKEIENINYKLANKRSKFTDNSIEVQSLLVKLENLDKLFFKSAKNYLETNINRYELIEKSSERPIEVLLNYSELLRNLRVTGTKLAQLEQEKLILNLEISKELKPWSLITKPTLKKDPVSPNKKKIIFVGVISGLFLSIIGSFLIDKRKDRIYKIDEIKNLLNTEKIFELRINDINNWNELISLFIKGIINSNNFQSMALIPIGEVKNIEIFSNLLKKSIAKRKLIETKNLIESSQCDLQIAITSLSVIERKNIIKFKNKINLQGGNLDYVILLNE